MFHIYIKKSKYFVVLNININISLAEVFSLKNRLNSGVKLKFNEDI